MNVKCCIADVAELSYSTDFTDDSISLTRSYKCDRNENYTFKSGDPNITATISVLFIQLQAFKFANPETLAFGSGRVSQFCCVHVHLTTQ